MANSIGATGKHKLVVLPELSEPRLIIRILNYINNRIIATSTSIPLLQHIK
jgi:hypothetical protein